MGIIRQYMQSPIQKFGNERFYDYRGTNVVPRGFKKQNNLNQRNSFKSYENTLASVRRQRCRSRLPNVYIRRQNMSHSDNLDKGWKPSEHNDKSHKKKNESRMHLTGKATSKTIYIQNQVSAPERFPRKPVSLLPSPTLPPSYQWLLSFGSNWIGAINMLDMQTCRVVVEPIRGYYFQFSHLMERDLHIVGGIKRSAFWQCMKNIKKRGRKTVSVSLIKPAGIFDVPAYKSYFNYFCTRRQLGHISYHTENMSFFLLLPLPAGKRIKSILRSFQTNPTTLVEGVTQTDVILAIMILMPSPDIQTIQIHSISNTLAGKATISSLMLKTVDPIFPPLPKESPPKPPSEPDYLVD